MLNTDTKYNVKESAELLNAGPPDNRQSVKAISKVTIFNPM